MNELKFFWFSSSFASSFSACLPFFFGPRLLLSRLIRDDSFLGRIEILLTFFFGFTKRKEVKFVSMFYKFVFLLGFYDDALELFRVAVTSCLCSWFVGNFLALICAACVHTDTHTHRDHHLDTKVSVSMSKSQQQIFSFHSTSSLPPFVVRTYISSSYCRFFFSSLPIRGISWTLEQQQHDTPSPNGT